MPQFATGFHSSFARRTWLLVLLLAALVLAILGISPAHAYAYTINSASVSYITRVKEGDKDVEVVNKVGDYTSIESTMNAASSALGQSGCVRVVISLDGDWYMSSYKSGETYLEVPEGKTYEFQLNGYMIDRCRAKSKTFDASSKGEIFYLNKNSTLTVKGSDGTAAGGAEHEHGGYLSETYSGKAAVWTSDSTRTDKIIKGGLLTGGRCNDKGGGGAICAYDSGGHINLENVTIAGNAAVTYLLFDYYGQGGAVSLYDDSCSLSMDNSTIKWNASEAQGGGVYVNSAALSDGASCSVSLKNGSSIEANYAKENGGGISAVGASTSINLSGGSKIADNTAGKNGGGISSSLTGQQSLPAISDATNITLDGESSVEGNYAAANGGGICINDTTTSTDVYIMYGVRKVTVKGNSSIADNQAGGDGGGLYLKVNKSKNDSYYPDTSSYGVILTLGYTLEGKTTTAGNITGNKANRGAGVFSTGAIKQQIAMVGSKISNNTTTGSAADGGGIYTDVQLDMSMDWKSEISHNTAEAFGGGIYSRTSLSMIMDGASSISYNEAKNGDGGGLLLHGSSNIDLEYKSSIAYNTCSMTGGGINVASDATSCTLSSEDKTGLIEGNAAQGKTTDGEGGGVIFFANASMSGLTVRNNHCFRQTSCGGGIYIYNRTVNITDCTVTGNNVASSQGGGIGIKSASGKAVLGGKVIVSGNTNVSGEASDLFVAEPNVASKSDIENDASSLPNSRISVSKTTPLKSGSKIGLQHWSDAQCADKGATYHPVSVRGETFTANTSYFFSDDYLWIVDNLNEKLVLRKPQAHTVTVYGASTQPTTFQAPVSKTVELNSSDYEKSTTYGQQTDSVVWKLDYWTLELPDGSQKTLTPSSKGVASFTMPDGDVTVRAHYVSPMAGALVRVQEETTWDKITADEGAATLGTLSIARGDGQWLDVPAEGAQITTRTAELKTDDDGMQYAYVTYTVKYDASFLSSMGLYADAGKGKFIDFQQVASTADDVLGSLSSSGAKIAAKSGSLSLTYTVKYQNPFVTLTFNPYPSTSTIDNMQVYRNRPVGKLPIPTCEGHIFKGWLDTNSEYATPASCFSADTELKALWEEVVPQTRLVRFIINGEVAGQEQVVIGSKVTRPTSDPVQEGYTFYGWAYDRLGNVEYNFDTPVPADAYGDDPLDIYAVFTPNLYTVTFDYADGSDVQTTQVRYGSAITKPNDPVRAGYDFQGWALPDGSLVDFDDYTVTGNVTLTAQWTKHVYTVTFTGEGIETFTQKVVYGETPQIPEAPEREHYVFKGWYLDAQGEKPFNFDEPISADTTVCAKWSAVVYVTLKYNNGADNEVWPVQKGSTLGTLPTPSYWGHTFLGWFDGNTQVDGNTCFDNDTTIDAKWDLKAYTVSFDTAGGSSVKSQQVQYGSVATKPAEPKLKGFTFNGWVDADGAEYKFDTPVTGNLTLYAQWSTSGDDPSVAYVVSFDTAGGSEIADKVVASGKCVTKPEDPVLDGFTFDGWVLADGTAYDFDTPVTGNLTLYAQWSASDDDPSVAYVVSFNTAGGSEIADKVVASGKCVAKPEAPVLDGFTFAGWTLADGTAYDFDTPVTGNLTLYAQWVSADIDPVVAYLVTFDSAGGSEVSAQTIMAGKCATEPESPTREGYTFKGWALADGSIYDFSTPVDGNLVLTAVWEKNPDVDPEPESDPEPEPEPDPDMPDTPDTPETPDAPAGKPETLPGTGDNSLFVVTAVATVGLIAAAAGLVKRRNN